MKRQLLHLSALLSLVGLLAALTSCKDVADKERGNILAISQEPADALVQIGSNADFQVTLSNLKGVKKRDHHWFFNGNLIDATNAPQLGLTGQDTPHLHAEHASFTNVGFYIYRLDEEYDDRARRFSHSHAVELMVYTGGVAHSPATPVVVYGTPIGGADGSSGAACPGPYGGYVNYSISPTGWYLTNSIDGGVACDTNGKGTTVRYYGVPSTNSGCSTNIPYIKSYAAYPYHFTIYFPANVPVPTGPYPITLQGFTTK
jgi:hypothetical protein